MESVFTTDKFNIIWRVMFDTTVLKDIDAEILSDIQSKNGMIYFVNSIPGDFGHQMLNKAIDDTQDSFIYILDDDNIIHENFYESLHKSISSSDKKAYIFHQKIDGKDFTGLDIRTASLDNVKRSQIDSAQYVLHKDIIGNVRLQQMNYIADSIYIEEVYNSNPDEFYLIDEILCYYNYLQKKGGAKLPRILYIGDGQPSLKTNERGWWESHELEVLYRKDDSTLDKDIIEFDPDFIVSIGDYNSYQNLVNSTLNTKRKWINLSNISQLGEISYNSAMNNILERYNKNLVSFFTPIYNTGEKLLRLYSSIKSQIYTNWEWVIVNDSSDGGKTLKIAESIAELDSRVKVYDFRKKSSGVIGESKYRCATLCDGDILVEIDHDDYILPHSSKVLVDAFNKYPDAGFAYTDCVEITEDWKTLTYPEGFCLGYGSYRKELTMGVMMDVNNSPNINPKTIRHIVGVPNHIRAWKRDVYFKIGGHNRRLSIADDYELIVRTFLETKFIRIISNCYLQFIYKSDKSSNTHEISRADIQRRVRSISDFYNVAISKRFNELGLTDWAYDENPTNPIMVPSRFGVDENSANYDYIPQQIN